MTRLTLSFSALALCLGACDPIDEDADTYFEPAYVSYNCDGSTGG